MNVLPKRLKHRALADLDLLVLGLAACVLFVLYAQWIWFNSPYRGGALWDGNWLAFLPLPVAGWIVFRAFKRFMALKGNERILPWGAVVTGVLLVFGSITLYLLTMCL